MGVSSLSAPSTRIASAGQAQAHSSQPTHFSSPSGWRLSWWRPWKRGAVGRGFSGYSSVATLRNIVENDTPKPATGAKSSDRKPFSRSSVPERWSRGAPTSEPFLLAGLWGDTSLPTVSSGMVLLLDGGRGARAGGAGRAGGRENGLARRGQARGRLGEALARERRHGVAVLEGVDLLGWGLVLGGRPGGTLVVPDPGRRERDDRDD